ncbi:MAG: hypothetical protein LC799_16290, partial [Actinobacteria bacterium]|nr:hypothetical protein [Actinomycetota bacterium]
SFLLRNPVVVPPAGPGRRSSCGIGAKSLASVRLKVAAEVLQRRLGWLAASEGLSASTGTVARRDREDSLLRVGQL